MKLEGEKGATAVEYALMAGLIAVAIAIAVGMVGTALVGMFTGFLDANPFG